MLPIGPEIVIGIENAAATGTESGIETETEPEIETEIVTATESAAEAEMATETETVQSSGIGRSPPVAATGPMINTTRTICVEIRVIATRASTRDIDPVTTTTGATPS